MLRPGRAIDATALAKLIATAYTDMKKRVLVEFAAGRFSRLARKTRLTERQSQRHDQDRPYLDRKISLARDSTMRELRP
jgi:hypothetical protein